MKILYFHKNITVAMETKNKQSRNGNYRFNDVIYNVSIECS